MVRIADEATGEKVTTGHLGWAFLVGLVPLALLVVMVAGMLQVLAVLRPLLATYGFFEQQNILLVIVTVGFLLVMFTYIIVCRSTLRRIRTWQQNGHSTAVTAGHWALSITAIVVVLPIIASFFQH